MRKLRLLPLLAFFAFVPGIAKAHCPLCTVGAGALAVGAAYLGVSVLIVGIFIGACALALGLWMSKIVKKKYIPHQKTIIALLVIISTIIPIMPLIEDYQSINIFLFGEYGSLFNRTYMYNSFIAGTLIGIAVMYISPTLSAWVKKKRNGKLIPYQGIIITFTLLSLISLFIQFGR
ncbi:MAG: hypothetical protein HYV41_04940 [Candidatus Magasanikbacteria bacterium]|nr:hypothetical protein [Candidatus Magasanikbacteria bacterium]